MAADLARKCQLPNCQISNSHKFLHNIHGQQEQSFLHRLYKNLDCGVAEIHCILSEICQEHNNFQWSVSVGSSQCSQWEAVGLSGKSPVRVGSSSAAVVGAQQ